MQRPISLVTLTLLLAAVAAWSLPVAMTGCAKKDPVSSANSGLRPAGGGDSPDAPADGNGTENGNTSPDGGAVAAGNGGQTDAPGGNGASGETSKPPTRPADDGIYKVPDAGPAALVGYLDQVDNRLQKYVQQLQGQQLSGEASQVIMQDLQRLMDARITACERILADDQAKPDERQRAVEAKVDSLGFMQQIGDEEAQTLLAEFAQSLKDDENPQVRSTARTMLLDIEIDRVLDGEQADPTKMIEQLKELLAVDPAELDFDHFSTARRAAVGLLQNNQTEQGVEVLQLIGDVFGKSDSPELVEAAQSMSDQSRIIQLDHAYRGIVDGDEGAAQKLTAVAQDVLSPERVGVQSLMMVHQIAQEIQTDHPETSQQLSTLVGEGLDGLLSQEDQELRDLMLIARIAKGMGPERAAVVQKASDRILTEVKSQTEEETVDADALNTLISRVAVQAEFGGNVQLAEKIYKAIGDAVARLDESEAAEAVQKAIDDANKRIGLIGEPFEVTGTLPDGKPFDWKQYDGKVVLVDFWATWCGPCLREIPNIRDNYEKFREQGFEVVGVNLDDDPADVEQFFQSRGDLPWPTVLSPDPDARGFDTPLAKKCGVTAIPFVVLVGKDGNVRAIHVRGEELGERLAGIFGEPMPGIDDTETGGAGDVPEADAAETTGE